MSYSIAERVIARTARAITTVAFHQTLRHARRHCKWHIRGPLDQALQEGKQVILTAWHQDGFVLMHYLANYTAAERRHKFVMLASRSFDGELAASVIEPLGIEFVRGSAGKKGAHAALIGLMRALKEGKSVIVIGDGPQPPAYRMQNGPVFLAQRSGVPLYVVRGWARPQLVLSRIWFKMIVPLPYSHVAMFSDGPIDVSGDMEEARARAETSLNRLCTEADAHLYLTPRVNGGVPFYRRAGRSV